jgi:hypothetical protein
MTMLNLTEKDFIGYDADNDRVYRNPVTGRLFCGDSAERLNAFGTPAVSQGHDPEDYLAEFGPITREPK